MLQVQPYLFTSPRMIAMVDRPQMIPTEGPIADAIFGYHTLWAAEVPFIPAHVGKNDRDFNTETTNRIARAMQRQVRFLYDLAQSREHLTTFELRLVSRPQANGLARVGIAFLGKTFHPNEQISRQLALELWNKFNAVFPREVPFSYPLVPVGEHSGQHMYSFQQWYEPIPFEQLAQRASIVEIRKFEDWPTLRNIGGVHHAHDYIPHPFVAALDYSAMARLFETMAHQQDISVVAITLRPQLLTDQEELILHEHAGWFERLAHGEDDENNPIADMMRELKNHVFEAYPRARAELGQKVYDKLKRESRSLFTIRLQIIGSPVAQNNIIESLGSEIMANAGTAYPSRWSRVEATTPQEFKWVLFNWQWLEFVRWGISPLIQQCLAIVRLRQLTTVLEAAGAFRLPVAPGNSELIGLEVRDEPFSLPSSLLRGQGKTLDLGSIVDRGVSTTIPYSLPISTFSGVSQIIGDSSETREQIVRELLQTLKNNAIPWVLIGNTDTTNTRAVAQLATQMVFVDAASPALNLQFHPLLPPPNISLSRFLDVLQRVLMVACELDVAAGALLRRALINTYAQAGWTEQCSGHTIDLTDIAAHIDALAQQKNIPTQLALLLQTRCSIALQDLATTAANLRDAPFAQMNPYQEQTIFMLGWLGSDTSATILRGCLWAWLSLALSLAPTGQHKTKGVVALLDAHALLGSHPIGNANSQTSSPLISMIQQSTCTDVGTLLIDERPYLLNAEITHKAEVSIITHNADQAAQAHMAAFIGASPRQKTRMSHLRPMEAVIAVRGSAPAFIIL